MDLNQIQNEVFHRFLKFGLYVFLEIAYNYSMRQVLTSGPGKTHEKKLGTQIWAKREKSFSPFPQVWFISFLINCIE